MPCVHSLPYASRTPALLQPQVKKGLGLAKKGLRVMKGGQTAFRLGGKLKHLLPFRKKAAFRKIIN